MSKINDITQALADEGDKIRADPMLRRIHQFREDLARRKRAEADLLQIQAAIARERDELIGRVADMLGIRRADFPTFFDNLDKDQPPI